jgi:hypothetical protein
MHYSYTSLSRQFLSNVMCDNIHVSFCSKTLATPGGDLLVDYSKNLISQDVMKLLFDLVC